MNHGYFLDHRATTLEDQVLMAIQDAVEIGMTPGDLSCLIISNEVINHIKVNSSG